MKPVSFNEIKAISSLIKLNLKPVEVKPIKAPIVEPYKGNKLDKLA